MVFVTSFSVPLADGPVAGGAVAVSFADGPVAGGGGGFGFAIGFRFRLVVVSASLRSPAWRSYNIWDEVLYKTVSYYIRLLYKTFI